ncbi:hypothetical protein B0O80DRAFT_532780 [Mortierella sp. GBAus27b]|nr:hypothetical protein B0O80DRAFT_532780 [Mortierella sp. GBAus27b]
MSIDFISSFYAAITGVPAMLAEDITLQRLFVWRVFRNASGVHGGRRYRILVMGSGVTGWQPQAVPIGGYYEYSFQALAGNGEPHISGTSRAAIHREVRDIVLIVVIPHVVHGSIASLRAIRDTFMRLTEAVPYKICSPKYNAFDFGLLLATYLSSLHRYSLHAKIGPPIVKRDSRKRTRAKTKLDVAPIAVNKKASLYTYAYINVRSSRKSRSTITATGTSINIKCKCATTTNQPSEHLDATLPTTMSRDQWSHPNQVQTQVEETMTTQKRTLTQIAPPNQMMNTQEQGLIMPS